MDPDLPPPLPRRAFVGRALAASMAAAAASPKRAIASGAGAGGAGTPPGPAPHPLLTPAGDFYDVSRGRPKPHTLTGEALVKARLTPETWRLEIVADPATVEPVKEPAEVESPLTLAAGTALDLAGLIDLGRTKGVRYLKAMQCLNIPEPLGQGLWEGVPLREVLRRCGALRNVRRIYYHGFHHDEPAQLFQSSLSYSEAMETAPGDPPVFLAYRLNGEPLPLERGGPVRMVVPWAHGFKSIKWLQRITLTNDFRANDTYAAQNNDPDSPLKTAAYLDAAPERFEAGRTVRLGGRVISGVSGLRRVEYWLRRVRPEAEPAGKAAEPEAGEWAAARWIPCDLEAPPGDWSAVLPPGVSSREVLGFDPETGRPGSWPLRYSMVSWAAGLEGLTPGRYEFRARAVDGNGFAQPEPRPAQKAGRNAVEVHRFEVA